MDAAITMMSTFDLPREDQRDLLVARLNYVLESQFGLDPFDPRIKRAFLACLSFVEYEAEQAPTDAPDLFTERDRASVRVIVDMVGGITRAWWERDDPVYQ